MSPDVVHFTCILVADLILSGVVALLIATGVLALVDRYQGRRR